MIGLQLRLLRLGRVELLPAAARHHSGCLRRRGRHQLDAQRPWAPRRHDRDGRGPPRDPRLVQVLRLHLGQRRQRHEGRRAGPGHPAAAGGAAHRHQLLHVHGDQLRHRHLSRQARAGEAARLRGVPLLLPPPPGRADRTGHRAAAPDPPAPRSQQHRLLAGVLAHLGRAVQEGRDLVVRLGLDRDAGLHVTKPALRARGDLRRLGLRGADLLRLQRLHRHRHRPGAAARIPLPAELRRAVHGAGPSGLLAPLAHDAVALAARLPLHPARRQPRQRGATRCATS